MVSFDEFKDVCIPTTATNSDDEQICMYVCMLSISNLLILPGAEFTNAQAVPSKLESSKYWENCIHKISEQNVLVHVIKMLSFMPQLLYPCVN